jgi:hypothetical protein
MNRWVDFLIMRFKIVDNLILMVTVGVNAGGSKGAKNVKECRLCEWKNAGTSNVCDDKLYVPCLVFVPHRYLQGTAKAQRT